MQAPELDRVGMRISYEIGRYLIVCERTSLEVWSVSVFQDHTQQIHADCQGFLTESSAREFARQRSLHYHNVTEGRSPHPTFRQLADEFSGVTKVRPADIAAPVKGTATKLSPAQVEVLRYAREYNNGIIPRGGNVGEADIKTLMALAKRNRVILTYETEGRRKIVVGATIKGK